MEKWPDFFGRPASAGLASGPVFLSPEDPEFLPEEPLLADQKTVLHDAIAIARKGLVELASHHEQSSADILEFQIEMLDDPSLRASMDGHLQQGFSALAAWNMAYCELVDSFSSSDRRELRDRAVDVSDLKNRGLRAFHGSPQKDFPAGSVFVARDMEPSVFLSHDWSQGGGIILQDGSDASHVAILARARLIPMVVDAGHLALQNGDFVSLDGQSGRCCKRSASAVSVKTPVPPALVSKAETPSAARPGHLHLYGNISDPTELAHGHIHGVEGIGLVRTEFLIRTELDLYDLDRQVEIYRSVFRAADGKPVTFRLFDFGFDKPIPGTSTKKDMSPLGLRGIRLLLRNSDLLKLQIKALLQASHGQEMRVMVPVVSIPEEMHLVRELVVQEFANLAKQFSKLQMPEIGMMVEVPSAAIMLDQFSVADFFSFGTNDLAQYIIAADRHDRDVADLYNHAKPAVLRLIKTALSLVQNTSRSISVCGDLGADPDFLRDLVALGISRFSVALDRVIAVDTLLASTNNNPAGTGQT